MNARPSRNRGDLPQRLRQLRQERGWTLEQTSQHTGVAISTLSKIENGLVSPTYDILLRLAQGLKLDLAELFTPASHAMGEGRRVIERRGEGQVHLTPFYEHRLLCSQLSYKRMMPFHTRLRAFSTSTKEPDGWSQHDGEEFVYVLKGQIELHTDCYEPETLAEGDSFYIDSRMRHRLVNATPQVAEVLWITTQTQAALFSSSSTREHP